MLAGEKPAKTESTSQLTAVAGYAGLFEQYQAELVRYLYGLVNEWEAARDLAQETFVRGFSLWREQPDRSGWRPLLYRIATNCGLDLLRRQGRWRPGPWQDDPEEPAYAGVVSAIPGRPEPDPASHLETRLAVRAVLDRLDPLSATILLLHYEQGFSCAEIAPITGLSLPATWQRLSRARRLFCTIYRKEQSSDG